MHLSGLWTSITYVLNIFTLSPSSQSEIDTQIPLGVDDVGSYDRVGYSANDAPPDLALGPIFKPPSGQLEGDGSDFLCNYTAMKGWTECSTSDDRGCWLKNANGQKLSITTNYELLGNTPHGIDRFYELDVTDDTTINADGVPFTHAKLFNRKYPGPWIQACWGDTVTVKINNWMAINGGNGTSIHWHGVRMLHATNMDGVNGVTQCPIAPSDSFTYKFRVMQYGSSWYHSHFSVQYADGLLGPLTFHGPTIAPYDEALDPLLMTDWGHNSAFNAIQRSYHRQAPIFDSPSILLNGKGNATRFNDILTPLNHTHDIPAPHTVQFDRKLVNGRPKRYLLRLINTAFASTYVFTIDNHYLQVVGADFVPMHNFTATSVLVGIGQRYHVIVEAKLGFPTDNNAENGNFYIRTYESGCTDFLTGSDGYETVGIVRYSDAKPQTPISKPWPVDQTCNDEYWEKLKPVVEWEVKPPSNGPHGEDMAVIFNADPQIYPLALASMGGLNFNPLYVDYSNPTFLNMDYSGVWDPLKVVYPEPYNDTQWIWVNITAGTGYGHPIHLHGHDFAIISNTTVGGPLNLKNPPRRDVVIPNKYGDTVIAFKADNPGTWLMHCHIAFHASFGLAMQFLENKQLAVERWNPEGPGRNDIKEAQRVCDNWNKWWGDCRDWWPGDGKSCGKGNAVFTPDSGI